MATTNLEFYKNNADNDFECNLDYDDYDFDDDYDETEEYRQIKRDRFRKWSEEE